MHEVNYGSYGHHSYEDTGLFHHPPKLPSAPLFDLWQLLSVTTALPVLEGHRNRIIQATAFRVYLPPTPPAQGFPAPSMWLHVFTVCPPLIPFRRAYCVCSTSGMFTCVISPGILTTSLLLGGATQGSGGPRGGVWGGAAGRLPPVGQAGGSAHRAPEPDL